MTYTWQWRELATAPFIARLYAALGETQPELSSSVVSRLERLFELVGGIPFATDEPDLALVADELVTEACTSFLGQRRAVRRASPGVALIDTDLQSTYEAVAARSILINRAAGTELDTLPGIGPRLAQEIVTARQTLGWFESLADLEDRVDGVGVDITRRLAGCLDVSRPTDARPIDDWTMASVFSAVASQSTHGPARDLVSATLDVLIAVCARYPHPASIAHRPRLGDGPALDNLSWHDGALVVVLAGDEYPGYLRRLLDSAQQTIDICMFHIARGASTAVLMDAVVAAHGRGIGVRVLLDQDRPTDPYNSTVINARARRFFARNGIPVHQDTRDRLLHSKYVVIDTVTTVIGSHNWSAGSFAAYDDVSVALTDTALAADLTLRFDTLWRAAEEVGGITR